MGLSTRTGHPVRVPLHKTIGETICAPGQRCTICHHAKDCDPANVLGNSKWMLSPSEIYPGGQHPGLVCALSEEKTCNEYRDMAALEKYTHDEPIGWGWHPGGNRTPAPGTQAHFGALFNARADSGAQGPG